MEILNNLAYIKEKLHHGDVHRDDALWMVNTIGKLLLENYFTKKDFHTIGNKEGED